MFLKSVFNVGIAINFIISSNIIRQDFAHEIDVKLLNGTNYLLLQVPVSSVGVDDTALSLLIGPFTRYLSSSLPDSEVYLKAVFFFFKKS